MSARSGVTPDREVVSIARGLSAIRRLPRSSCHDIRTEDARGTRASTSPAPRVGARSTRRTIVSWSCTVLTVR